MTTVAPTPTAEQIATLDPDHDFDAAYAAGVTYSHRRAHILTFVCPRPRCPGRAGEHCTTPNSWLATGGFHRERCDLAYRRTKTAKPRKHRLTDPQAQHIEVAAETDGTITLAGQWAQFGGDAAERATGDALLRAGLFEQVAVDNHGYGERTLQLTAEGWRQYWHNRLVIRRLPDQQHDTTCPCAAETGSSQPT